MSDGEGGHDAEEVPQDTAAKSDSFTTKDNGNVSTEVLSTVPDNISMTAEKEEDKVSEGGEDASDSDRHSSDEEPLALSDSDSDDASVAAASSGQAEESDGEELSSPIPMPPATLLKTSGYISVKDLYANHEQNLRLIQTVKPITFLYDVGGGKFSRQLTEEMKKRWEVVGRKMRCSPDDCRILWTHMKSEFRAKLKCYEESNSETYRRWPYYKHLEFLTPYIHKHRRVKASPKVPQPKPRQSTSSTGPLKVKLKLGKGRPRLDKSSTASPAAPLPKRARALPAKLQDYVSNDYMSQIEIAQKLQQSKPSVSDSDSSSSSSSSSSAASSHADGQQVVENSDNESLPNGGISERVKRKREKGDESGDESDTEEKDAIYVTELSIDGIPTVVIESAVTLSEQEQEQILKAAAATGSTVAPDGSTDGAPVQRVSLKLKYDEDAPAKGRGRPHKYSHSSLASDTPRKRGRPRKNQSPTDIQGSPDSKMSRFESDDESVDEKSLVVTISDRTNVNRVHCQRISYREAKRINLKGFDVDEWMGVANSGSTAAVEGEDG